MRPVQRSGGGVLFSKRPYPIASGTSISVGQLVKLSGGLVVAAAVAETGKILGIAAETHSGSADALDPRANGTEVMVWDSPDLIFECAVPVITATGGTATTVVTGSASMAAFAADDFNGGWLKLRSKAKSSTNTDAIGSLKQISDFADSSGSETFTVASGGTANEGDVFEVYPPLGFVKGNLDSGRAKYVISGAASLPIKVVGYDFERGVIRFAAGLHFLGTED